MQDNYGANIAVSMIPIVILFAIVVIYYLYKKSKRGKANKNEAESNAIIEAQAMLARIQKEKAELEAQKKALGATENSENNDINTNPDEQKAMSENETSRSYEQGQVAKKPVATPPKANASDFEPDIDKSINA